MHKFQQASIQGVPLKMLALLTTEQQESRTLSLEHGAIWMDQDPHWPNYPQRSNSWRQPLVQTPPHNALGGAWVTASMVLLGRGSGSRSYVCSEQWVRSACAGIGFVCAHVCFVANVRFDLT